MVRGRLERPVGALGTVLGGRGRTDEPPEVAGAVEADEDLAQEAGEAHRLAPQLEHVDRCVHHGACRVDGRERRIHDPVGRREQALAGHDIGIARAAGQRRQADVGARARAAGDGARPGRHELDDAARLATGLGESRRREPVVRGHAAQDARDQGLRRVALEQEHDPRAAAEDRLDAAEGPGDGGRLPAPRRAHRGPEQWLEGQRRRGLAPEDPRRGVVGPGQALGHGTERRGPDHQPDPRPLAGVGEVGRLELQGPQGRRGPLLEHRRRRTLDEAPEVVPEAGRDGAPGAALEALDEPADQPHAVLEREPRVTLPPVRAARQTNVARGDLERGDASGRCREAARRSEGVEDRQAQRRGDRRRPEVALDSLEDRRQRRELARRVQVEQLIGERLAAFEDRKPVSQHVAGIARIAVQRELEVVGVERRLALLAATQLVAAHGTAIVLAHRLRTDRLAVRSLGLGGPRDLVEDDGALAGGAATREPVGDRRLEAGFASGGRRQRLDRRVEMAEVWRPEDDLGQQAVERRALEAHALALAVDGGPGDPAAPPEQVEHDVAWGRCRLDPRGDEGGRRRRREPLECRQAEARFRPQKQRSASHQSIVADWPSAPRASVSWPRDLLKLTGRVANRPDAWRGLGAGTLSRSTQHANDRRDSGRESRPS